MIDPAVAHARGHPRTIHAFVRSGPGRLFEGPGALQPEARQQPFVFCSGDQGGRGRGRQRGLLSGLSRSTKGPRIGQKPG
ncbi:hypothetical protein D187_009220 [Cystobacter fuscus DSM 2262]|uniref:Uncharacterized protein n=1 Tax=Cystobacter fuscus (strain ATCC 25194 / DSM 2262 / NBRC 100088 / M29) TaxID=1242864 RepID=S9Q2V6_CYSF2|nr:hypothetical protein D187_009220 [Cystobacter fuscus DSM 2262]